MNEDNEPKNKLKPGEKIPDSGAIQPGPKEPVPGFAAGKEKGAAADSEPKIDNKPASAPSKSRFQRIVQRSLAGLIVLIVIFGAGALTIGLVYLQPANQELVQTEQELTQAEARIKELEKLVTELDTLSAERQTLEEELVTSQTHIALLRILTDVNAARIALGSEDLASAKLYLSKTPQKIEQLGVYLGAEREAVDSMLQRLKLVNDEISRNKNAALTDLALIASQLIQIENTFFAAP